MIKEIAFVGYPTTNMKKARSFYEGILGLVPGDEFGPVTDESEFVEYAVGTNTLAIGYTHPQYSPDWEPSKKGPSIYFEMENFEEAIKKLKDNNVTFTVEPIETPSCSLAIVLDPDGNSIGIHQRKIA